MLENSSTVKTHELYTVTADSNASVVLLSWKHVMGVSAKGFADGIVAFAEACVDHEPDKAVIDARELDQHSEAVGWLRGTDSVDGLDSYEPWWQDNVVPIYNKAQVKSLVVATGDPAAPGELEQPVGVDFRVVYLTTLEDALAVPAS